MNESENLRELLPFFFNHEKKDEIEVIVVDGCSKDDSVETALIMGAKVVRSEICSRACQMNMGSRQAKGDILYFVHADTRVLPSFYEDIVQEVDRGVPAGCFAYSFDSDNRLLRLNSWFTTFNGLLSGGGDQTLFIKKEVFEDLKGFDEYYCIMEDFELVRRLKKKYSFHVIPKKITVSARKYETNSWLRVQVANLIVFTLFFFNTPSSKLKELYSRLLIYR